MPYGLSDVTTTERPLCYRFTRVNTHAVRMFTNGVAPTCYNNNNCIIYTVNIIIICYIGIRYIIANYRNPPTSDYSESSRRRSIDVKKKIL